MGFPKLKHALLCRILPYVLVLGGFIGPIIAVCCIPSLSDGIKVAVSFGLIIALLVYLFRNVPVLMGMDLALAFLHCMLTAKKSYPLPARCSVQAIQKRIRRFGKACEPTRFSPQPDQLRYRLCPSATIYAKGIEKVVASYQVDLLDANQYRAIFHSATTNSNALTGKKTPRFLDSSQQKAPLNRVTLIVILAKAVDPRLWADLYDRVCKQEGDGLEESVVPCVIDLQRKQCIFNSMRLPYTGFAYPVKNRGIRLVKRLIFCGRFPVQRETEAVLMPKDMAGLELGDTLWQFWRKLAWEMKDHDIKTKKRMAAMEDRQILLEDELLYAKWGERAICLWVEQDSEKMTATIESFTHWSYPKPQPIAKKTAQALRNAINGYFSSQGYRAIFEEENQ